MNYHDPIPPTKIQLRIICEKFHIKLIDDGKLYETRYGCEVETFNFQEYLVAFVSENYECRQFKVHHIIWYMRKGYWPEKEIDHEDLNRKNNKINNLRYGHKSINQININKKSGLPPGVSKHRHKFTAKIKIDGWSKHLGVFDDPNDAFEAYKNAYKDKYGSEYIT